MRTFYSLTKRQFLGMTKFNKFLYGNSKEKKVFAYTFFAIGLTAIILFFCWFRMVFQICGRCAEICPKQCIEKRG